MNRRTELALTAAAALTSLGAAWCLSNLFAEWAWLPLAFAAVVVVVSASLVGRLLGLPRWGTTAVGSLALLLFLTMRFAPADAVAGFVPTPAALASLAGLISAGTGDILKFTVPVPTTPGLLLLIAAGVGLISLMVDAIAVTYRSAALAGLPLLLYAVPAAIAGQGLAPAGFVIAGIGYLVLLYLDRQAKLAHWGRNTSDDTQGRRQPAVDYPVKSGIRRPAVATVAMAVVIPVALAAIVPSAAPALTAGVLSGDEDRAGKGNSTVEVVNPILNLREDLVRKGTRNLLRYSIDDPAAVAPRIRLVGLDSFTGSSWEPGRLQVPQRQSVDQGMTGARIADDVVRTERRLTMSILRFKTEWLPLPYPTVDVDIESKWLYDKDTYNVFATADSSRDAEYVATYLDVAPTPQQLRAAQPPPEELQRFLELPPGMPNLVRRTAERITDGAPTAYDQAQRLTSWLQDMTYSERAPEGSGWDSVENFLRTERGFCVHFASTMAIMARHLGIPARVAVGFLPGSQQDDGQWLVTSRDAHAWPELYFHGVGWVPFEPTPDERSNSAGQNQQPTVEPEPTSTPEETVVEPPPPVDEPSGEPTPEPTTDAESEEEQEATSATLPPWIGQLLRAAGVLALLVLVALIPALIEWVARRRRWRYANRGDRELAAAGVAQLRSDCLDHGEAWSDSATPRQLTERLTESFGEGTPAAAAASRLLSLEERLRYAPDLGEVDDVRGDIATVREQLRSRLSSLQRARIFLLPPSLLSRDRRRQDAYKRQRTQTGSPGASGRARRDGGPIFART